MRCTMNIAWLLPNHPTVKHTVAPSLPSVSIAVPTADARTMRLVPEEELVPDSRRALMLPPAEPAQIIMKQAEWIRAQAVHVVGMHVSMQE